MTERVFRAWPKIARLNREIVVTEKLDGTNAAVVVSEEGEVWAQSRTRIITPEDDNYGFAAWVESRAHLLVADLGPGFHFGEWWGRGIQRNYGMSSRVFSLFNTERWHSSDFLTPDLAVVPVIYSGIFSEDAIEGSLGYLREWGSDAAPGFFNPEGVVVYHTAARTLFKVLLEGDDLPKSVSLA